MPTVLRALESQFCAMLPVTNNHQLKRERLRDGRGPRGIKRRKSTGGGATAGSAKEGRSREPVYMKLSEQGEELCAARS